MLQIKNAVAVAVRIFLKHSGQCGQTISSSQLCYVNAICMHVMCTVVTVNVICEGLCQGHLWSLFKT